MAMKYCPDCGTRLVEGANFCPECGKPITPAEKLEEPAKAEETIAAEPVKTVEEPVKTEEVVAPAKTEEPSAPAADVNAVKPPCPPTYLVKAIVLTCVLFPPCGIPAIVNATQVESAYFAGNYELAKLKSDNAAKWCHRAIVWGIAYIAFILVIYIIYFIALIALDI